MTSTLDGHGQLTLMHGASAGHTAGQDLAALGSVLPQLGGILEVDVSDFIHSELANLPTTTIVAGGTLGSVFSFHDRILLLSN